LSVAKRHCVLNRNICMNLQKDNGLFSIGQAAKKAGVSRQSVQYYIMVGLLSPVRVSKGGTRLFDEGSVERIKLIKKLNESGYPLRAIRELFVEGSNESKDKSDG